MASTTKGHDDEQVQVPPGEPMSMGQHMLDKGAQMMQSLKPMKQMNQHVCTFAMYNHDMSRQIETHHYITRVNQDFLQCAVYDSDESTARLIGISVYVTLFIFSEYNFYNYITLYAGVEYILSDRIFESLPQEEQKLWHSHAHEVFIP